LSLYEGLLRGLLFRQDPEAAHERALDALGLAALVPGLPALLDALFCVRDPALEVSVAGIRFPNPVGLGAGFDKDCRCASALPLLGFGFVELGTLTARPQPGNPKPRLFRFPEARAVVNRMGFNNQGAEAAAARLSRLRHRPIPIGLNIGINKDVKPEDAAQAYCDAFKALLPHGDYFTVNVSSPNTQGLRMLQEKLKLERILTRLQELNTRRAPIFVKLAPELSDEELESLLPVLEADAAGVICTNTTTSDELKLEVGDDAAATRGGLSGAPLRELSTRLIREVYRRTEGRLPIIGVGGVMDARDAWQKLCAGASLVQVYTGLVYRGPGLPKEINKGLLDIMKEQGISQISEAIGRSHPLIERKPAASCRAA
jgi:dihydroorotate dehydrogenase